ncbi:macro domain-containing protein [Micromonospora rifamycinica]|uniref:macro domain-containing protein n=1 Tax=Micromonospora rifamycinica TaxID=291594 RepID=UPI00342309EA
MNPPLLGVTGALMLIGILLQVWFSAPQRAGRQAAMQLPSVLLYAVAVSLLMFSIFPESYADGRALGFSIGGAAAFVLISTTLSFQWLARAGKRDTLEAEVRQARQEVKRLKLRLTIVEAAQQPQRLHRTTRTVASIRQDRRHRLGIVTGNIANVTGIDVWVNAENIQMEMARPTEPTISGTIRYRGGRRDAAGNLVDDLIYDELRTVALRTPVAPATVFTTSAGMLAGDNGVKRILHVASVDGSPGTGYRQVSDIGGCMRNVLAELDRLNTGGDQLRTVVMPLLGTGNGGGDPERTAQIMVEAALDYFRTHPASRIRTVYLLAFTDLEERIIRLVLTDHRDISGLDPA